MTMSIPRASGGSGIAGGLILPGLTGANPLGFLAALGLLRRLSDRFPPGWPRMGWTAWGGTWVPVVVAGTGVPLLEGPLLDLLESTLTQEFTLHPASLVERLEAVASSPTDRRKLIEKTARDGELHAWASALASDFVSPDAINQLQTTRRDYFLGNLKSVIARTRREHLERAIFHPWDYGDALDNQSLHLDPSEDRRHAYQWNKPAGDPERKSRGGMLGANRLALEAIPLFTSLPGRKGLRTLGFSGDRSDDTRWTWPIWSGSLSIDPIVSMLGLTILQQPEFDRDDRSSLRSRGIVAVYRTRRILVEKTPNFTPPRCLT
ncbi:type I-G CRISPR-associated protein, Cas3-extension family [Aquisphaera insulae]|uniref:type I-G CRISPR-associated protein, Cas3-extension family n=1 Tax=Aquisphaera insulae TaxID=2712864 RepID=UPI0013ED19CB|nr:hypothetical protein [Aquisphaera insulae]